MKKEKRIVVIGLPGSGKTSFARKLSLKEKIPHIEGDAIFWKKGIALSLNEFRDSVSRELQKESWIYEGHFHKVEDLVLARATQIIAMDTSATKSFYRLVKRELVALATDPLRFKRLWHCTRHWRELCRSHQAALEKIPFILQPNPHASASP